jgi:hypothetical protein
MSTSATFFWLFALVYLLVFALPLLIRPFWPFRLRQPFPATPQAVWALLKDDSGLPNTHPRIKKFEVERDPDDPEILYSTVYLKRRTKPFRYVTRHISSKPVESIACECLNAEQNKVFSRFEYHLSADGPGTLVELRARTRVCGPFSIFMTRRLYRHHLNQLATMAEWS